MKDNGTQKLKNILYRYTNYIKNNNTEQNDFMCVCAFENMETGFKVVF